MEYDPALYFRCRYAEVWGTVCYVIAIVLCLETACGLLTSERFKGSRPMHLHLVCSITWLAVVLTYSAALHIRSGPSRNSLLILSAVLDVLGRSILVYNVATRALCVLTFHQKVKRATQATLYVVIILIIASVGGLIPAYIQSNGLYSSNHPGYHIYVAGIILDLIFSIVCDTLYLYVIRECVSMYGRFPHRRTTLASINLVVLMLLEVVAIVLVLTDMDQQFGAHYVCTALRIRFFTYIVKYTDRILRTRNRENNRANGIPSGNARSDATTPETSGPQTGDTSGFSGGSTVEADLTAPNMCRTNSIPPRMDVETGHMQRPHRNTDQLSLPEMRINTDVSNNGRRYSSWASPDSDATRNSATSTEPCLI
ncbi:hypothetical protein DFS34DRAFT_606998 [Phlyctochytrium arcticum]|nr:hypothetical protein DFS34DRAFT_606998 [Phlyctochytrium arcticum]